MSNLRELIGCNYAYEKNIYGRNVGVAVVDTGIANHTDFGRRITAFYDITNNKKINYDDNGHGTHVTGLIDFGI